MIAPGKRIGATAYTNTQDGSARLVPNEENKLTQKQQNTKHETVGAEQKKPPYTKQKEPTRPQTTSGRTARGMRAAQ